MDTKWELARVEIEHFRGVAGSLSVDFAPGLNILAGDNGAGKTSICYAIEWVILGKIAVLAGADEFQAEDAITSRLTGEGDQARVVLTLSRDGQQVILTRSRHRGSSTTRGTAALALEIDGEEFRGSEAEAKLVDTLSLDVSGFSSSIYLRQELIANLVLGDEELRSAAIDRLLGVGQIREMLENLQLSAIDRAAKNLEAEAKNLQEGVIAAAGMRRIQLARRREDLATHGVDEAVLSMSGATAVLNSVASALAQLGSTGSAQLPRAEKAHGTLAELQLAAGELDAAVQSINDALTAAEVTGRQRQGRLGDLKERWERATAAGLEFQKVDLGEVTTQLDALDAQKNEADAETRRTRALRACVLPICERLATLGPQLQALRATVGATDENKLQEERQRLDEEILRVSRLIERHSELDRLIGTATNYLAAHPSQTCPVCAQPFDAPQTLRRLEEVASAGTQESAELNDQLTGLSAARRRIGESLADLEGQRARIARSEADWGKLVGDLTGCGVDVGGGSDPEVAGIAPAVEESYRLAQERRDELDDQYVKLKARVAAVQSADAELEAALSAVRQEVESDTRPIDVRESIAHAAEAEEKRLNEVNDSRTELRSIRDRRLVAVRDVLAYLREVNEVTELEQNVPPVRRRLRQIESAHTRLTELRSAALDVHNALTQTQGDALSGNLAELMPRVEALYSALGGHPEYARLVVKAENDKKTGTNVYRLRAESENRGGTFVRTVFSRGELNAVALALFLAVTRASENNLGVSLLDDPAQSLDGGRERALAGALRDLANERQVVVATEEPTLVQELTANGTAHVVRLVHRPYEGSTVHV